MKSLLLIIGLFLSVLPASFNNENEVILQEVLNIEDFNQYITKNPRFISSQEARIIMIAHEKIGGNAHLNIHEMPVTVMDSASALLHDKIFYIKIDRFEVSNKTAIITLDYKNARLFFEENKKVTLSANLKKIKGEWKIKTYDVNEISISG